jgi:MazG family protein
MPPRKSRRKPAKSRKSPKLRKSSSQGKSASNIGCDFEKLVAVMARLRAPGGCPWDREQTHSTLRTYLIEEAYEVLDALDSTDDSKFAEELGDLLLQVLFHAQIAHEEKRFSITDVIREIHDKMVRRHPHVFGTTTAKTAADVLRNWEIIKKQERAAKSSATKNTRHSERSQESLLSSAPAGDSRPESYLDGVPRTLPALLEAVQLTRKAARVGFDWPAIDGIFAKLSEETHELQAALDTRGTAMSGGAPAVDVAAGLQTRSGEPAISLTVPLSKTRHSERSEEPLLPSAPGEPASARIESELGDILFVAVNLARFLHVDPELALKKTSAKFTRRFHRMEQFAREQGTTLAQVPREELESFWDRSKLLEQ